MIEVTPAGSFADAPDITPWRPPTAPHHLTARRGQALQPLLAAAATRLSALFACPAELVPPGSGETDLPTAAATLAGLRLGGTLAATTASGAVVQGYHDRLKAELQALVDRLWPSEEPPVPLPLMLLLSPSGGDRLRLRLQLPAPGGLPRPTAGRGLAADLPLGVRVELASHVISAVSLLPLEPGLVLPVTALAEMPLRLGDHCIGRARVVPLPDGRQQATVIAIDVQRQGEA